jgi:hypothetical protein
MFVPTGYGITIVELSTARLNIKGNPMERRDFLKGIGGLVVITSLAGITGSIITRQSGSFESATEASPFSAFTTAEGVAPDLAVGPLMLAGIDLIPSYAHDELQGFFADTHLFNVNALGAALIKLADGSRTLAAINAEVAMIAPSPPGIAGVAEFFITLGQAGYLQNQIYVALYENRA